MLNKTIFFTSYHDGVNRSLLSDFQSLGYTVYMPDSGWGKIWFFAPNHQFVEYDNVKIVSYNDFIQLPPMILMPACVQQLRDFEKLYIERNRQDRFLWLTATQDAVDNQPNDAQFILSHDIIYHRQTDKPRMLYFNRPTIVTDKKKDIESSYNGKQVNSYINHLRSVPYHSMICDDINIIRESFQGGEHGLNCKDGMLDRATMQQRILESFATICIKDWETFGQTVTESMLLWTPGIFLRKFLRNTLQYYEVTDDNAFIADTVEELVQKMKDISLSEYEVKCIQARSSALQITSAEARLEQLDWLLNKIINS